MSTALIVDTEGALAAAVTERIEAIAREAIAERGRFAIALPGGSVATTCFPRLAQAAIDWPRVHVFFADERAAPPTSPDSNYGLALRLLLSQVPVPPASVHRMEGERPSIDAAAEAYEAVLTSVLGDAPELDLVLLGVGEDGHVCSLFPEHPALDEDARWVVAVDDAPKPPARRVTLTMPTLLAARHTLVVAIGTAKAAVVREALEDPDSNLPVAIVAEGDGEVLFVIDRDAAGQLGDI